MQSRVTLTPGKFPLWPGSLPEWAVSIRNMSLRDPLSLSSLTLHPADEET